jgi:hypothetical protein
MPGLASYKFASDATLGTPHPGTPDNVLGLNWASTSVQALNLRSQVNTLGGSIRTIQVGDSGQWLNDFGITLDGNPASASSFTVLSDIQAKTGTPYPVNFTFGSYFDVNFGIGAAASYDVWLNGVGGDGLVNPVPPTQFGGVYTAFNPANSMPYNAPGNVMWTTTALMVNTWIPTLGVYMDVPTYLVGFEDWKLNNGSDKDFNDAMFAFQFFKPDGTPFTPVPEPSTYGLIGAVALLGLVAARRFKSKK